jgi:hypothetical protein
MNKMDILRNYKNFLKESVDSDKDIKSVDDVPSEVIETAKKIASDIFDRVKKPTFEFIPGKGLVMKFYITDQDFNYIDKEEPLTLDVTEGARKKRTFDVTLNFLDAISETFEVKYIVEFDMLEMGPDEDDYDDDDEEGEDIIIDDDYEKYDDEDYFDEDVADKKLRKRDLENNIDEFEFGDEEEDILEED